MAWWELRISRAGLPRTSSLMQAFLRALEVRLIMTDSSDGLVLSGDFLGSFLPWTFFPWVSPLDYLHDVVQLL